MERDEKFLRTGGIVRVRSWEDMAGEFSVDASNRILTPRVLFIESMEKCCGKRFVICGVQETIWGRLYRLRDAQNGKVIPYWFTVDHFDFGGEPVDFSILENDFRKLI